MYSISCVSYQKFFYENGKMFFFALFSLYTTFNMFFQNNSRVNECILHLPGELILEKNSNIKVEKLITLLFYYY